MRLIFANFMTRNSFVFYVRIFFLFSESCVHTSISKSLRLTEKEIEEEDKIICTYSRNTIDIIAVETKRSLFISVLLLKLI